MCIRANKENGLVAIELKGQIYPEEVVDAAVEKSRERFETSKACKKDHFIVTIKAGKKVDLELLGYEFANYLLYFSRHI